MNDQFDAIGSLDKHLRSLCHWGVRIIDRRPKHPLIFDLCRSARREILRQNDRGISVDTEFRLALQTPSDLISKQKHASDSQDGKQKNLDWDVVEAGILEDRDHQGRNAEEEEDETQGKHLGYNQAQTQDDPIDGR